MGVRRDDLSPSIWLLPFDERGFKRSIEAFAAADALLRDDARTRLAMRWIEAGMNGAYDSQSRLEYHRASLSDDTFEAFLEERGLSGGSRPSTWIGRARDAEGVTRNVSYGIDEILGTSLPPTREIWRAGWDSNPRHRD